MKRTLLVGSLLLVVACVERPRRPSAPVTMVGQGTPDTGAAAGDKDSGVVGVPMTDAGTMLPMDMDAGERPPPVMGLPVLGQFSHSMDALRITMIGERVDGLDAPSDIEVDPSTGELYVTNKGDNSMWIITNPGESNKSTRRAWGFGSYHFQPSPSALAFGLPGELATAQDIVGPTQPGDPEDFMGPTLFTTDQAYYDAGHEGHIDMLHNSPWGMGIAWESDRIYWYFDGYHGAIARYDFQDDHGPGGTYHGDGIMGRYVEGQVSRAPGVPSHMAFDPSTNLLYIADSGNNRIAVLDTTTGSRGRTISPNYDGGDQYYMDNATITTLVDGAAVGMSMPSGLEIHGDHIFVTDYQNSMILAFTKEGDLVDWLLTGMRGGSLMGIALDDEGALYVVDAINSQVMKIEPSLD